MGYHRYPFFYFKSNQLILGASWVLRVEPHRQYNQGINQPYHSVYFNVFRIIKTDEFQPILVTFHLFFSFKTPLNGRPLYGPAPLFAIEPTKVRWVYILSNIIYAYAITYD